MTRITLTAALLLAAFGLPGCKIVKTADPASQGVAADATGDDARIAALLDETYDSKLLPLITDTATALPDLRTAFGGGLDAAGQTHGHRASGEGAAWNFAVTGQGRIVAAKLDSRARTLDLDTDGDGGADVTLQLGPVVKGTSLRDVAPFYIFTDFRDQIEFAKLGRAINDRAAAGLMVPEGDPVGQTARFTGVMTLKSAADPVVIMPIAVQVTP